MGEKKMNELLFTLSVISAIFLPAQFITGLYGMNFVLDDGSPNMPELTWPHGYTFFWCLQALFLFIAITLVVVRWRGCNTCCGCRSRKHSRLHPAVPVEGETAGQ